jgi:hypothetical protein
MTRCNEIISEKNINDADKAFLCLYLFTSLPKSFMIKGDGTMNDTYLCKRTIPKLKERER